VFLRRKQSVAASDEELVTALCSGHRSALGDLWDRYAQLLYGVGLKYLKDSERSKDLVVELFTTLPGLLAKQPVQRFRPWVHTVMRNRCLMALRSDKGHHSPLSEHLSVEDDAEEAVLLESSLQQLDQALQLLNEAQRSCIRLFYLEHHSYHQCAERTGLTVEQVRSHLQNGRRNLKLHLERLRNTA
jgi:RNA polymerase sigma-70 factor (ECF subfamily)